jgi:hypothetical protein
VQEVENFIPDGRHIRTSNRASRGDNYYKNCIRIRIHPFRGWVGCVLLGDEIRLLQIYQFGTLLQFIIGTPKLKAVRT